MLRSYTSAMRSAMSRDPAPTWLGSREAASRPSLRTNLLGTHFALFFIGWDALEPDLAEIGDRPARAQQGVLGVVRLAIEAFQRDAGILHVDHPPGRLVDDPAHALRHAEFLPAGQRQLLAPRHPAIESRLRYGIEDLVLALHFHPFPGAQVELFLRGARAVRKPARAIGIGLSRDQPVDPIVEPEAESISGAEKAHPPDEIQADSPDDLAHRHVAGAHVFDEMPERKRFHGLACRPVLRGLAGVAGFAARVDAARGILKLALGAARRVLRGRPLDLRMDGVHRLQPLRPPEEEAAGLATAVRRAIAAQVLEKDRVPHA